MTKTIEERLAVLEHPNVPDTSNMTEQHIAELKATGIVPVGEAAPNPLGRNMEMLAEIQRGWNLPPLSPAEALERYSDNAPPELCLFTQKVLLTDHQDHRRVAYPKGWHLVPQRFATQQLAGGYAGCEIGPRNVLDQLLASRARGS